MTKKNFNEETLKMQYLENLLNDNKIAHIRNKLLRRRYAKLPSYCFWVADDLVTESMKERKAWIHSLGSRWNLQ